MNKRDRKRYACMKAAMLLETAVYTNDEFSDIQAETWALIHELNKRAGL